MTKSKESISPLEIFYNSKTRIFRSWSPDIKRKGLYALHAGYQNWQEPTSNPLAIQQMNQKIIDASDIKPNQIILDAGCGVGSLTFEIASQQPTVKVFGIDIVKKHILLANRFKSTLEDPNVTLSLQDYHNTSFPNSFFDRVIFCESFIHSKNKQKLIEEAYRLLKTSGKIILSDVLMNVDMLTKGEKDILDRLKIMGITSVLHLQALVLLLKNNRFSNIEVENLTQNVIPLVIEPVPELEKVNTRNIDAILTGMQKLLADGKVGYYIITAETD